MNGSVVAAEKDGIERNVYSLGKASFRKAPVESLTGV
jgi:hypothetical protein